MKNINNYINEALIKKDTKIKSPILEDIYKHFKIIKPAYIDTADKYFKELKDNIEKWIELYKIKDVDGPYIYGDDYYSSYDPDAKKLFDFIEINNNNIFNDYKKIEKKKVKEITDNYNDWCDKNKIDPSFKYYPNKNDVPYLLGTSRRISIEISDISGAVIIYLVK